ncbi:hypothetical protein, partial [Bartonella sp. AD13SXNS]|uniref:hypothetical protein n=1 Tax=Bartonella sp. AD13SXNS TaxID=3243462 RepID=UPI0035D02C12
KGNSKFYNLIAITEKRSGAILFQRLESFIGYSLRFECEMRSFDIWCVMTFVAFHVHHFSCIMMLSCRVLVIPMGCYENDCAPLGL